jgi:L-fucose isomerase-like protein
VLLAVGGAAYGAIKLSQKDSDQIEEYTGASVEELSEEELIAAMDELGIQSIELTDDDKAIISDQEAEAAPAEPAPTAQSAAGGSYLDDLERLGALRDQGVLTEEEFQAQKQKILGL